MCVCLCLCVCAGAGALTCLTCSPWLQILSSRSHRLAIRVFSSSPVMLASPWPSSTASRPIFSTSIRLVWTQRYTKTCWTINWSTDINKVLMLSGLCSVYCVGWQVRSDRNSSNRWPTEDDLCVPAPLWLCVSPSYDTPWAALPQTSSWSGRWQQDSDRTVWAVAGSSPGYGPHACISKHQTQPVGGTCT